MINFADINENIIRSMTNKRCLLFSFLIIIVLFCVSCHNGDEALKERAAQLCQYIPDHELKPEAKDFMTEDFYDVLSAAFNAESLVPYDNEWLYTIVTGNGGTLPKYTVLSVNKTDDTHAVAEISVEQIWEDSTSAGGEAQIHKMNMDFVGEEWLIADFDDIKQQCIAYIRQCRQEKEVVSAIEKYIEDSIGAFYSPADVCIPCPIIVAIESTDSTDVRFYGDFWVYNYNIVGDTLEIVSGGSYPGCMHVGVSGDELRVIRFDRVADGSGFLPTAKAIFGKYFDDFQRVQSNEELKEEYRLKSVRDFVGL